MDCDKRGDGDVDEDGFGEVDAIGNAWQYGNEGSCCCAVKAVSVFIVATVALRLPAGLFVLD